MSIQVTETGPTIIQVTDQQPTQFDVTAGPTHTINVQLPGTQGNPGPTGPAPTLSGVIVTTGAAGSSASGSFSGTNPYDLNLTIPRGDKGDTGATGATVYTGSAPPSNATGVDGDKYIVTSGSTGIGDTYTKTAGTWGSPDGNIRGPAGTGTATFAQSATPTPVGIGDLWINTGSGNRIQRWDGGDWLIHQLGDAAISDVDQSKITGLSASLAGKVSTTGAETIAGVKTFSNTPVLPALTITTTSAGGNNIEIGRTDGVTSSPFIDFHSGATTVDYDARIAGTGGNGAVGGGTLTLTASTISLSVAPTISALTASRVVTAGTGGILQTSTVTTTELGYLSGVTSAVQTQLNGKVNNTGNETIAGVKTFSSPLAIIISTAANDTKSTMFSTSAGTDATLGALLYSIYAYPSATAGNRFVAIGAGDSVAMRPLVLNSNASGTYGNVGIGLTNPSERLEVTGNIKLSGNLTVGGLTASRVVTSGTGGLLGTSATTTTELGYLSGVTSAIQTQLDGKVSLTVSETISGGKTFTGGLVTSQSYPIFKGGTTDAIYISLYRDAAAQSTRSSYIGYGGAGTSTLTIANEISTGQITLSTTGNGGINLAAGTGAVSLNAGTITLNAAPTIPSLTVNRVVTTGAGGILQTSATTTTELGYLSGVTSAVQTQLGGKVDISRSGGTASADNWKRYYEILNHFNGNPNVSGSLVIQTNMPFGAYMTNLRITGYQYLTNAADIDLSIAFYAYGTGPQFLSHGVVNKGSVDISQVRLMRRTSDNLIAIVIDVAGGTWQYPRIQVDGQFAFFKPADSELSGWTVTYTTDLTAYTAMATPTIRKYEPAITAGTTAQYIRGDKSLATMDKTAVGLSNVDNTSDANKFPSTYTRTALTTNNAVYNGDFEIINGTLPDGWTTATTGTPTISVETTAPLTGTKAIKVSNPNTTSGGQITSLTTIAVVPGEQWDVSGWFKASVATTSGIYLRAFFYTAAGAASATSFINIAGNAAFTTSWVQKEGIVTVPSDATTMQIVAYAWTANVAYDGFIDRIEARRVLPSTLVGLGNVANLAQVDLVNAQTIAGVKTFSSAPIISALTANRALTTGASGVLAVSATTDTELGYLSGVTSAIQTQLNGKASTTGGGKEAVAALSATTGTATGDLSAASVFTVTPTGNITLAFSNIPSGVSVSTTVIISQGATAYTVTMPAGTTWLQTAPTQVANKKCVINMLTVDGGTNWYATAAVQP